MSSQRGNVQKKGPPKHQNKTAFRHNPKSKKTAVILALPNEGLCAHCHEKIEWKKKYRKYKRLTTRKRCTMCEGKSIVHAYHTVCQDCARAKDICAWCQKQAEIVNPTKTREEIRLQQEYEEGLLAQMSLRERRSYLREKERRLAAQAAGESPSGEPAASDDDDDDDDDDAGDDHDSSAGEDSGDESGKESSDEDSADHQTKENRERRTKTKPDPSSTKRKGSSSSASSSSSSSAHQKDQENDQSDDEKPFPPSSSATHDEKPPATSGEVEEDLFQADLSSSDDDDDDDDDDEASQE